ncbi:MAG: hypothetical protein ACI9OH_001994, partial [Oleispira sp.]
SLFKTACLKVALKKARKYTDKVRLWHLAD